jgi:hypothetical protein
MRYSNTFVPKLKFLDMIEKLETVEPLQLANYLNMRETTVERRLRRYTEKGWLEYLMLGDSRRCLSPIGCNYLYYLREQEANQAKKLKQSANGITTNGKLRKVKVTCPHCHKVIVVNVEDGNPKIQRS